ncbi:hypothetical protein [Bifidobacterium catenulatum]|uniref:hypothetical protein n=1 Tax=Bifidobacterium catenulatum TaxID=1686 RepID=UPI003F8FFC3D
MVLGAGDRGSKASVIRLAVWQASSRMPIVLEVGVPWPSSGTLKSVVSALWTLRSAGLLMMLRYWLSWIITSHN